MHRRLFTRAAVAVACCPAGAYSQQFTSSELEICVEQLPECLQHLGVQHDSQERVAYQLVQAWLQQISALDVENPTEVHTWRQKALHTLLAVAKRATERPPLALAVGQALHSYFWWGVLDAGVRPSGPNVEVLLSALQLHELSLQYTECDVSETVLAEFLARKCPWRWRFVLFLGSELGLHLASGLQDFALASATLERTAKNLADLRRLPFFQDVSPSLGPLQLNQNWDYFPDARHWPVWPREAWPSFATLLEENYATIRKSLEGLLSSEAANDRFGVAAKFQNGLTPHNLDWSRLKIIHSGGKSDLCQLPFMTKTCDLLSTRPEIGPSCGTYLSGASFARLLPGAELKPHIGTHPRLTVHLSLRTPNGASLTVGGERRFWREGKAIVFDDTYPHKAQNEGDTDRYVLVAWFCHPCDLGWRQSLDEEWQRANPLPSFCGKGGGGYLNPPAVGYGEIAS